MAKKVAKRELTIGLKNKPAMLFSAAASMAKERPKQAKSKSSKSNFFCRASLRMIKANSAILIANESTTINTKGIVTATT